MVAKEYGMMYPKLIAALRNGCFSGCLFEAFSVWNNFASISFLSLYAHKSYSISSFCVRGSSGFEIGRNWDIMLE